VLFNKGQRLWLAGRFSREDGEENTSLVRQAAIWMTAFVQKLDAGDLALDEEDLRIGWVGTERRFYEPLVTKGCTPPGAQVFVHLRDELLPSLQDPGTCDYPIALAALKVDHLNGGSTPGAPIYHYKTYFKDMYLFIRCEGKTDAQSEAAMAGSLRGRISATLEKFSGQAQGAQSYECRLVMCKKSMGDNVGVVLLPIE